MDFIKRRENERKFPHWEEFQDSSRVYWFEIEGRMGWKAKYLKQVDDNEVTLKFWQEIFDESGILVEVHEKYPVDKGHKKIEKP